MLWLVGGCAVKEVSQEKLDVVGSHESRWYFPRQTIDREVESCSCVSDEKIARKSAG